MLTFASAANAAGVTALRSKALSPAPRLPAATIAWTSPHATAGSSAVPLTATAPPVHAIAIGPAPSLVTLSRPSPSRLLVTPARAAGTATSTATVARSATSRRLAPRLFPCAHHGAQVDLRILDPPFLSRPLVRPPHERAHGRAEDTSGGAA